MRHGNTNQYLAVQYGVSSNIAYTYSSLKTGYTTLNRGDDPFGKVKTVPVPIDYFDRYFVSWGEVRAAARTTGMSELPKDQRKTTAQLVLSLEESIQK